MYVIGLDIGQQRDPTALVILERVQMVRKVPTIEGLKPEPNSITTEYHGRHIEQLPLGTPYPAIVEHVRHMMARPELTGRVSLVVDAGGVGMPVVDMMRQADLQPIPVIITGGNEVTRGESGYRVPKRDLVAALQVLFHSGRLKFSNRLPLTEELKKQLQGFTYKITKNGSDTYEAMTEMVHDDLVLAAALAAWYAERHYGHALEKPVFGKRKKEYHPFDMLKRAR